MPQPVKFMDFLLDKAITLRQIAQLNTSFWTFSPSAYAEFMITIVTTKTQLLKIMHCRPITAT
jgi:hypothetical protein